MRFTATRLLLVALMCLPVMLVSSCDVLSKIPTVWPTANRLGFDDLVVFGFPITSVSVPSTGSVGVPLEMKVAYKGKEHDPEVRITEPIQRASDSVTLGVSVTKGFPGSEGDSHTTSDPGIAELIYTPDATGTLIFLFDNSGGRVASTSVQ